MTPTLEGRALDEACAKAMGTYVEKCDGYMAEMAGNSCDGWFCSKCRAVEGRWGEKMPDHAGFKHYSTDPATDAEKLAWLTRFATVELYVWACGNDGKPGASAMLVNDGDAVSPYVEGATISEALARLVVAVAEAKR